VPEIEVGDLTVHHQRLGSPDGETVVLLHGLLVDNLSSMYLTLAPALVKAGMDVLLYDQRGHGRTRRTPGGYTFADAVDDLFALLDALGIAGPVHLAGNSYGALVAIEAARTHPERVASLVLIEAHFAVAGWGDSVAADIELAGFGLRDDEVIQHLGEHRGRKLDRLARQVHALIDDTSILDDLRAAPPLPREELRTLDLPTLAVYGEHSDAIARAFELEALLPRVELHLFKDCAHSVLFEATRTVRAVVVNWFARLAAGDEITACTRRVGIGPGEGDGKQHRERLDTRRTQLERLRRRAAARSGAGPAVDGPPSPGVGPAPVGGG
jgi:pimeloyl-ACP methyl ester carboxylesterase